MNILLKAYNKKYVLSAQALMVLNIHATWIGHHVKIHPCRVTLLQTAWRAALLGQSLKPSASLISTVIWVAKNGQLFTNLAGKGV
jgi:hypothetical protein